MIPSEERPSHAPPLRPLVSSDAPAMGLEASVGRPRRGAHGRSLVALLLLLAAAGITAVWLTSARPEPPAPPDPLGLPSAPTAAERRGAGSSPAATRGVDRALRPSASPPIPNASAAVHPRP